MRILLISRCPPVPLHLGDRLILHHLLVELTALGHAIDLVALCQRFPDVEGRERAPALGVTLELIAERPRRWHQLAWRLRRPFPDHAAACWQPALWRLVERRLADARYDVVHLFGGIQVYELRNLVRHVPNLITPYESHSLFLAREIEHASSSIVGLRSRAALAMTRRYERVMYVGFDRVVVLTGRDRDTLLRLQPSLPIDVIPNGVDVGTGDGVSRLPPTIVFSGNFTYPPNVHAARVLVEEVWPTIVAAVPGVRLRLIGADPPRALRTLAGGAVEVTGWVPDMAAALAGATCYVAPLWYGAGMKNKILEAMAAGVPVVTTPAGCDGLAAIDGEQVTLARSAPELAGAAIALIRDPDRRRRIAAAARRFVREHHAWADVGARYDALFRKVIEERRER